MSLAYDHLHGIIVCLRDSREETTDEQWRVFAEYIIAKAHHCTGLLILSEGNTASIKGRTMMHVALDVAKHLKVAFITQNEVTRVLLQRVIREYLGDRVSGAENLAAGLQHLGIEPAAYGDFERELTRLRDVARGLPPPAHEGVPRPPAVKLSAP